MNVNTQRAVEHYLGETLGIHPTFSGWKDSHRIPYAIRGDYSFSEMSLLGHKFVLVAAKEHSEVSPAKVAKHLAWIHENCQRTGVFVANGLEAYNRKRLIEHKVPFIIPKNQLYLPDLGIDFREHLRNVRQKRPRLSPSAQVVLLAHLLGKFSNEFWTATSLANIFDSTKMTMSRAIEDLEIQDLIDAEMQWREKQIHFKEQGWELWVKAKPVLRSPVQKRVFVENINWSCGTMAGLSALSKSTMIAAPSREIRALSSKAWKELQTNTNLRIIPEASADLTQAELEIWRYDPQLLSDGGSVDPLSLYLSLADITDERVQSALDELLTKIKW